MQSVFYKVRYIACIGMNDGREKQVTLKTIESYREPDEDEIKATLNEIRDANPPGLSVLALMSSETVFYPTRKP